jgi:hypothetical protein
MFLATSAAETISTQTLRTILPKFPDILQKRIFLSGITAPYEIQAFIALLRSAHDEQGTIHRDTGCHRRRGGIAFCPAAERICDMARY